MREILFRGKQRTMLDWVEGTGVFNDGTNTWLSANESNKPIACGLNHKIVLPETIGQFTGLTDKNGKKIFEGDVVLYPWSDQDKPQRFTIKFKDGQFVASPVKETEEYWDFMVGGYSKEMEIIGNIHDNPELLGGVGDD